MSAVIDAAVSALAARLKDGFEGVAKFVIPGEGTILLNETGVHVADGEAEVTLTADADTFRALFTGELNPTLAYMTGKLSVDGDMGTAMKLGSALS